MISDFEKIKTLLAEIDKNLAKKAHFYILGGAMLLFHGMKEATKDIDMIMSTKEEFIAAQKALEKMDFKAQKLTAEYRQLDLSKIFAREDFRIDLFEKTVCKKFMLSEAMMKRAEKIIELEHLTASLCSPEDVFLFKTFTEREGDLNDCIFLAQQKKIDWNSILSEIKSQVKQGEPVWITIIGERLDLLEERGLNIPILKEVNKLSLAYYKQFSKKNKN